MYIEKNKQNQNKNRKAKYKSISCFIWMMKILWKNSKSIAIAAIAVIPFAIVLYAFNLYITPAIIRMFEQEIPFNIISFSIVIILFSQLLFRIIKDWIDQKREVMKQVFMNLLQLEFFKKKCETEYYIWLNPKHRELEQRAWNASNSGGQEFPNKLANLFVNIICFLLFSSVIATLNPFIIVLLCICSLVNFFAQKYKSKKDHANATKRDLTQRKLNYLSHGLAQDMKPGKDIRLFSMQNFLNGKSNLLIKESQDNLMEIQNTQTFVHLVSITINMIRDGFAYALLLYATTNGELSIAQFSLYFGAISQLSGFFMGIIGEINNIFSSALQISDFREYMEIRGALNREKGISPERGKPASIEFRHVSYKYPDTDKNVINNVSFKIEAGEKIAFVGTNGAGKTTLINLMCGLIVPDEGEVLINNHSIYEYNIEELYKFFSIVPQNFCLLPSSIAENVTLCEMDECNIEHLNEALKIAGLWEKIASLKDGPFTLLEGRYNPGGIRLSGGEIQKLLLARAIYRKSQIVLLDEPTASLDPIAEDEIYRKHLQMSNGCTSVFISHRLASTRFCDRIFIIDNGMVVDFGTHDQLMNNNEQYREMFEAQSRYYNV